MWNSAKCGIRKVWNSQSVEFAKCGIWQSVESTYFEFAKVANPLVERQNLVVLGAVCRCFRVENVAAVNVQAVTRLPNVCGVTYLASGLVDQIPVRVEPIFAAAAHKIDLLVVHDNRVEVGVHKVRALHWEILRGPRAMFERFEIRRRLLGPVVGVLGCHFHLGLNCEVGGIAKSASDWNCEVGGIAKSAGLRNRHTEIANCNYV